MKPLQLSLLITTILSANSFAFEYQAPQAMDSSDERAIFIVHSAEKYPEIKSALEENRPINIFNLSNNEKKSLLNNLRYVGLTDPELIRKQAFNKYYKQEFETLARKSNDAYNNISLITAGDLAKLTFKTASNLFKAVIDSSKTSGLDVEKLAKVTWLRKERGLGNFNMMQLGEKYRKLVKKLAKYDSFRNILESIYSIIQDTDLDKPKETTDLILSNSANIANNTEQALKIGKQIDKKWNTDIFNIKINKKMGKSIKKVVHYEKIYELVNMLISEFFGDKSPSIDRESFKEILDIVDTSIDILSEYYPSPLITSISGVIGVAKDILDELDYSIKISEEQSDRLRKQLDKLNNEFNSLQKALTQKSNDDSLYFYLHGSEERARVIYNSPELQKEIEERLSLSHRMADAVKNATTSILAVNTLTTGFDWVSKNASRIITLTLQKPTSPTNAIPPTPGTLNQNINSHQETDITQQPQKSTTISQPLYSNPIANIKPVHKHGDVTTVTPAGPAHEPPHKAPDPAKTKALLEKIDNLKKLQNNLIQTFDYHNAQVKAAIREKRVNDEVIDVAKLANSERKEALKLDKIIENTELEYTQLVGGYHHLHSPIDIDSEININLLHDLIPNQNKNRKTYQDLAEWGGINLDTETASKFYKYSPYLEQKYINGTPSDNLPKTGYANYHGTSRGKTVVKLKDTGKLFDSYQYDSDFDLNVDFNHATVTPSLTRYRTFDHLNHNVDPNWDPHQIFNTDTTYSGINISSFNNTAAFKGKVSPQTCEFYCNDEEYQFIGVFGGPEAQVASGMYKGKGKFKTGLNNDIDIISETVGVFGARREGIQSTPVPNPVKKAALTTSSSFRIEYDNIENWGGLTLNDEVKNNRHIDSNNFSQNHVSTTPFDDLPKSGTASYHGASQMQAFNNGQAGQKYHSDFDMSVDFQKQTVNPRLNNISGNTGFFNGNSHDFGNISIEAFNGGLISSSTGNGTAGFKNTTTMNNGSTSKIVGTFVGSSAEQAYGAFEVNKPGQNAQLQGTFYGNKQ